MPGGRDPLFVDTQRTSVLRERDREFCCISWLKKICNLFLQIFPAFFQLFSIQLANLTTRVKTPGPLNRDADKEHDVGENGDYV